MKKIYFILSIVLLATISFPAQAENWSKYRIMLDPGHGGSDPGAQGPSAPHEATLALRCGLALRDRIVNELGGTVEMTRSTDVYVDLSVRREKSVTYDPYIFCSIHLNAFNTTAKGTETYYYHSTGNSKMLAEKVQPRLIEQFNTVSGYTATNRGVKYGNLAVIKGSPSVPAILTEGLFVDNKTEWSIVNQESKDGFKKWVHGHLLGFYDRLVLLNSNLTKPAAPVTPPADTSAPTIARCTTVANNATSFYAYAYATDNVGVTTVKFPTWTSKNDQDDLIWHVGTSGNWTVSGQTYNWRYLINTSDHKNEKGTYIVHIYAYDAAGNQTSAGTSYTFGTPKITYSPEKVTLSAVYGDANQPYADVTVKGEYLEADMVINSVSSGIIATTQSGWDKRTGGTLRLTLNTNFTLGASPEPREGYVAVESGSGDAKARVQIPFSFTLTAPLNPSITVDPATLSFSGIEGEAIASQQVTVTATDLSSVPIVSSVTNNFIVESTLTLSGGTITVAPLATLTPDTYFDTLTISADGVSQQVILEAIIDPAIPSELYVLEIKETPIYYNLQGMRVSTLESGLYICVQGEKVTKVFIK